MNGFVKKMFGFHTDEITPEWISYGKSTDGNYYYDKKSITKVSPQIFKVWTKLKYSQVRKSQIIQEGKDNGLPMDDWEKIDYTMDLLELDCVNNTCKGTKNVKYNNKGEILDDIETPNPDIIHIPPGSSGDKLLEIVCGSERTDRWVYYGTSDLGDYYYDKSSITNISPNIMKVWTKKKYSKVGKDKLIQLIKKGLPTLLCIN